MTNKYIFCKYDFRNNKDVELVKQVCNVVDLQYYNNAPVLYVRVT